MTSIRFRLLIIALLPLVLLLPLLLGVTMLRWIDKFDDLLFAKVASDIRVAEQYFKQIEEADAAAVAAIAQSARFDTAAQSAGSLPRLLEDEKARLGFDLLLHSTVPELSLPAPAQAVVAATPAGGTRTALALFAAEDLLGVSEGLAARATIPLVPTAAARPITRAVETRGMMLLAAYRSQDGGRVVLGGRLINRNLAFIDTMNDLIYREGTDSETYTGTTTLFLDDVRISTNVRLFEGERALGTRVSEVVWQQVMGEGRPWLDRAFVVNDWYISGYVPLRNIEGSRIGMLYTGFLEAPFSAQRNSTMLTLILAFLLVLCVSAPIFLRLARGVFAPLEKMTDIMAKAETGALDARIGAVGSRDEIGTVARHLDRLLDQVQERDEALRDYADSLNDKVERRTAELREANEKLEDTFAQLILAEKLASLGEITAGVAHEINNPVAVIQGNLELLREGLPPEIAAELDTELQLIDAQTHRINIIVGKLLNFTRPGEMSDVSSCVDVPKAVDDALVLVSADLRKHGIKTEVHHDPAPLVEIVETELTQVLVNLMINAAQAMGQGGTLSIVTGPEAHDGRDGTAIRVRDTGAGIPRDKIDHIFDPFFSTKLGEGTGLGLSISQALIARADGVITVQSPEGQGAEFFIWIPQAVQTS